MKRAFLALLAVITVSQAGAARLASPQLTEASGLAMSNRSSDLMWAINDSGHGAELFAVGPDGADLGRVRVRGVPNVDWEDADSFVLDGTPYLLIADVGDNNAVRKTSYLYIVEEPVRPASGRFDMVVEPVARLPFRYEDGPQDCEAVAVDVAGDRIVLVGKRRSPVPVFELPLTLASAPRRPLVARKVGTVAGLLKPTPAQMLEGPLGPWRHQPTGLALRRDAGEAALITYQNIYLYPRAAGQSWAQALSGQPRILPLPLSQTESVEYAGDRLIAVPEGKHAPLLYIRPTAPPGPM